MTQNTEPDNYLAVLKASYDYTPQSNDEVAIKEDQLLLLVERTDEDWWKVKVKGDSQDDEGAVGLVPAAYVEQAQHTSLVKVLYDYDALAPGELSVKEDDILRLFETEGDWILAQSHTADGAGYVPGNYVEAATDGRTLPTSQIVIPDSPPRPVSTYVDPADLVASRKITADDIKTWSVSEVDKKGKKKKGTLGIGNGSLFFASESDKAAVQKWQTANVIDVSSDKAKHIQIEIGGPNPISLHFHAGSKDNAEEIIAKTQSSKALATSPDSGTVPESSRSIPAATSSVSRDRNVHFNSSPVIIPAAPPVESEDEEELSQHSRPVGEEEYATVLYDFTADGDDELSVAEGERVVVLEKDSDDWWKCHNGNGKIGMVPASYLEPASGPHSGNGISRSTAVTPNARSEGTVEQREDGDDENDDTGEVEERRRLAYEAQQRAEKEAAERRKWEEEERMRKKREAQEKARAAAAAAEAEREKRKMAARKAASPPPKSPVPAEARKSGDASSSASKQPTEHNKPPPDKIRIWHDRTGQFRVEAAFLGFTNGKLRLHKINGVTVEVPAEKMSLEDMRYVEKLMAKKQRGSNGVLSDDEVPLAIAAGVARAPVPPKKAPAIDWFDFFLSAGCDVDDCTRYASAFERDKMDETLLVDITDSTMRSLGLREGDIIRVKKAIEKRKPTDNLSKPSPYIQEQIRRDEELARELQAQENGGRASAPNLFAGPGGALRNNPRRGRPQPKQSLPLSNVDIKALSDASEAIQRSSSPRATTPSSARPSTSAAEAPPRSSSTLAPPSSGFEDDAWTNRPSSAKPVVATPPPVTPRAPSAPPASEPSAPPLPTATLPATQPTPAPVPPAAPATATPATMVTSLPSLAQTTESDIFQQLARLKELRKPASPPHTVSLPPTISPPIVQASATFPLSAGMGMSHSSIPMGQLSQTPTLSPSPSIGPRGPFAPVPANQSLLQPLIPTQTGFNSFVPTRPPAFQNQPSLPQINQLQPMSNALSPPMNPIMPQQTGLPMNTGILSHPTGMPMNNGMLQQTGLPMNNGFGSPMGLQGNSAFGQLQPSPTGFNPSMNSGNFNTFANAPPVPPLPTTQVKDTSPANVFASMKSGTFESDNVPRPSDAYVYDPFRVNVSLQAQPTGWMGQGYTQNGMGYHQ